MVVFYASIHLKSVQLKKFVVKNSRKNGINVLFEEKTTETP